jgi:prepilin-type N-terminal cleavage/methylation domain-containing protein
MKATIANSMAIYSKRQRFHYAAGMHRKMKRLRHHAGFTLVELIIVIVIVGTLVAVAVPLYSHYTETAKFERQ